MKTFSAFLFLALFIISCNDDNTGTEVNYTVKTNSFKTRVELIYVNPEDEIQRSVIDSGYSGKITINSNQQSLSVKRLTSDSGFVTIDATINGTAARDSVYGVGEIVASVRFK